MVKNAFIEMTYGCRYTLEWPHRGDSDVYLQPMCTYNIYKYKISHDLKAGGSSFVCGQCCFRKLKIKQNLFIMKMESSSSAKIRGTETSLNIN